MNFVGASAGELLTAVMEERERAHEAELVAARWEEAIAAVTWLLSRAAAATGGAGAIPFCCVTQMLDEATRYAHVGICPDWLASAREQMGRG